MASVGLFTLSAAVRAFSAIYTLTDGSVLGHANGISTDVLFTAASQVELIHSRG